MIFVVVYIAHVIIGEKQVKNSINTSKKIHTNIFD